jgi:hypothetical protein
MTTAVCKKADLQLALEIAAAKSSYPHKLDAFEQNSGGLNGSLFFTGLDAEGERGLGRNT